MNRTFMQVVVVALVLGSPSVAGQVTTNLSVSISIEANCEISDSQGLAFGSTGTLATSRDAVGWVEIACTPGTDYTLKIAGTEGASTRYMTGPSDSRISYMLYSDATRSTPIAASGQILENGTYDGGRRKVSIYGRVPAQDFPRRGDYSDTLSIVLEY